MGKLRRYEKDFFVFFLIVLSALVLSTLLQFKLSLPPDQLSDGEHHHFQESIFSRRNEVVKIDLNITLTPTHAQCTYWNCIDSYKCIEDGLGKMSVYVYDIVRYVDKDLKDILPLPSKEYVQMLWAITHSEYIVRDVQKACIFIPSIDLLNRENFSPESAAKVLSSLPHWNNGTNHLLFNMLPGVFPDYSSTLTFSHGKAMLTSSGFTQRSYRRTFDISIPLFNPHQLDKDFTKSSSLSRSIFFITMQHTYYRSIHNQLVKLANGRSDVVILTNASHSSSNFRHDSRGKVHQYPSVLTNSKYCLITKERQLASIYLHDSLRAGCVPVVCMDTYVMPFSEVLDWARAAVFLNEHRLEELPMILTRLSSDGNAYQQLQEQGLFFYENYFKSPGRIALVTLDILNARVVPYQAPSYEDWNRPLVPAAPKNPFFVPLIPSQKRGFTAVILTYDRFELMKQVVLNIARSKSVAKIIIIWNNPEVKPPSDSHWPIITVPLKVIRSKHNWLSNRFYPYEEIETDCVLTIDDDITMVPVEELEFGYRVWVENSDRLVGFPPRLHTLNGTELKYDSEWMSNISMVLTGVAFYHKYYHYLFTSSLPSGLKQWVDKNMNCEDIAMNYLIANVTGKAPIKLLARKKFKSTSTSLSSNMVSHLVARNTCMMTFTKAFGATPLRTVEFRADPVLFKQEGYSDHMKRYKTEGEL